MRDPIHTQRAAEPTRRIRVATAADAPAMAEIYRPSVEDGHASFEDLAPTATDMRDRLAATLTNYPWLVAESDGVIEGYAYAAAHRSRPAYRWSADLAVYVAAAQHGRGVGRALYDVMLPLLTAQGLHTAYAGIALPNPASVRLHEACGFTPVGVYREVGFKRGAWHDVGWWERRLARFTGTPPEPVPFSQLTPDVLATYVSVVD